MKAKNGTAVIDKPAISFEFSKILEDEFKLYSKTWTVHWTLGGADFYDKNRFFESQYEEFDRFIDGVSERLVLLGSLKPESLNSYLNFKRQSTMAHKNKERREFIQDLLEDHERILMKLNDKIHRFTHEYHDRESIDFLVGLMEGHEKLIVLLRSNL